MTSSDTATDSGKGSTYASGGGGVVFEHRFGATLLVSLLVGDPAPGLGDEQTLVRVEFQAARSSYVDDLVLTGEVRGCPGEARRLALAVRRRPKLVPSDPESVGLVTQFLRDLAAHGDEIQSGARRLGLVAAIGNRPTDELASLAGFARGVPTDVEFRRAVAAKNATTKAVRARLEAFDEVVATARGSVVGLQSWGGDLCWRLLNSLYVHTVQLDGDGTEEQTRAVTRLRALNLEAAEAAALFDLLCRDVGTYAPSGAIVDDALLRRSLRGRARVGRSPSHPVAWRHLDLLGDRLRARTRGSITAAGSGTTFTVDRSDVRSRLADAMRRAGQAASALLVVGEPDVGKSAMALAVTEQFGAEGSSVAAMSLRDLPPGMLDLDHALTEPFVTVIGSSAVGPARLLLVDGAEAVLEGRREVLADLARAARGVGIGIVAVVRTDAVTQVRTALQAGAQPGDRTPSDRLAEFEIPGLADDEVDRVIASFPPLTRVSTEPRSVWLLRRLGLVDLLLRGDATASLPDGSLSEADIFAAIWHHLVRRREQLEAGRGTPDGREASLLGLARRKLLPSEGARPLDAISLPSLRSDGLLESSGATAAWSSGDEFASDLVRDLAVARLLVTHGLDLVAVAGAPRWALRAARLACQAQLLDPRRRVETTWREQKSTFSALAAQHGERWADLPFEALITAGPAASLIDQVWPLLLEDGGKPLARLMRILIQRHAPGNLMDPTIGAPLVARLASSWPQVARALGSDSSQVYDVTKAWLGGLAVRQHDLPDETRQRVRDLLLDRKRTGRAEGDLLECFALMGPDLDERCEEALRSAGQESPGSLEACVESLVACVSMARHRPTLLLDLADTYYIRRPVNDAPFGLGRMLDDGVRDHRHVGLGSPAAAWHYGPFWALIQAGQPTVLDFINRLLDHAARTRLEDDPTNPAPESTLAGIDIDLPEGQRRFVGDEHVWGWYRGSTVGPHACMSALLAVERFADGMHGGAGAPLAAVARRLLSTSHNLAMAGLVVGFLIRHLDDVTDELDPWLANPDVWHLEFDRTQREGTRHVQGRDPDELPGRDRRRFTFREVALELVSRALRTNDVPRLARLEELADRLVARATAASESADDGGDDPTVAGWAAHLRRVNYTMVELSDGQVACRFDPPADVMARLAPRLSEQDRGMQAIQLNVRYAIGEGSDRRSPEQLLVDLSAARALASDPPIDAPVGGVQAATAVAAAAVRAYAAGRLEATTGGVHWAASLVLDAAFRPHEGVAPFHDTMFRLASDRSAAHAVPALLLPPFEQGSTSFLPSPLRRRVGPALEALTTSPFDEVRRITASALTPVWTAACNTARRRRTPCRHVIAIEAVESGIRDCWFGPWREGQREPDRIRGDVMAEIRRSASDSLMLDRLAPAIFALGECATSSCCVASRARAMLLELLAAHARVSIVWAQRPYRRNEDSQRLVAATLLRIAESEPEKLHTYLLTVIDDADAIYETLHRLNEVATYDAGHRRRMRALWPEAMDVLLDAIASGRDPRVEKRRFTDFRRFIAVASLVPSPKHRASDQDMEMTLKRARADWLPLDSLATRIDRWIALGHGSPEFADALVAYLETLPPAQQANPGLAWLEELIAGRFDAIARKSWLVPGWLERTREAIGHDVGALATLRRIVDGLAAAGDRHAARIQQMDD